MTATSRELILIKRYEALRRSMQLRLEALAEAFAEVHPFPQLLALLQDDPLLEAMDRELRQMEPLLPDSYEYHSEGKPGELPWE